MVSASVNTFVNENFATASFNPELILQYISVGESVLKDLVVSLRKVNELLKSEGLENVLAKVEWALGMADKVLQNEALMKFLLSLLKLFDKNNKMTPQEVLMQAVLNYSVN